METGYKNLDKIINLDRNNLIVIGSRPAMGKTSLAFNIAVNVAKREKVPVAIFSLEMSKEQCTNRILSLESMIKINNETLNDKDWNKISDTEIYIDDVPGISVDKIREKCLKLKQEKNLGLVIIDYLQLIQSKRETSREQELSAISLALKKLSEKLNIPIIVTVQLSKICEHREDKRPILTDFIECKEIIEYASIIMFLYRDDYYNKECENKNVAEIIVAKNKYGNCGVVTLKSLLEYGKFVNI